MKQLIFIIQKKKPVLLAALLLLASHVQAESYQCVAEQLAGFVYHPESQTWPGGGSATDARFSVRHPSEDGVKHIGPRWVASEHGKDYGMACSGDFDENGFLHCEGLGGHFVMNKNTLRFQYLQDQGFVVSRYTASRPEGRQAPHMKIGHCQLD